MRLENVFKGDEFEPNETALLQGRYPVTVIRWDKAYDGWWYVRLQNGGLHYTRALFKNYTVLNKMPQSVL